MRFTLISTQPEEEQPLDAYSRVVTEVAERLSPSVANVQIGNGAGSAVAITTDGSFCRPKSPMSPSTAPMNPS